MPAIAYKDKDVSPGDADTDERVFEGCWSNGSHECDEAEAGGKTGMTSLQLGVGAPPAQ